MIAKSYARIGWQNLINFGILPLEFTDPGNWDRLEENDILEIKNIRSAVKERKNLKAHVQGKDTEIELKLRISDRQAEVLLADGLINDVRRRKES